MRVQTMLAALLLLTGCVGNGETPTTTTYTTTTSTTTSTEAAVECVSDGDCLPKNPLSGIRYYCEGGRCMNTTMTGEAALHCMRDGYEPVTMKQPTGITYVACVFPDGWCEAEAYLQGRCGPDTGNLTDCAGYYTGLVCTQEYSPVCAKVEVGNDTVETVKWRSFRNPCLACTYGSLTESVTGYRIGDCPVTTTTTLTSRYVGDAAAEYCERRGYVYVERTVGGYTYGFCVFGRGGECPAEEFFRGTCTP